MTSKIIVIISLLLLGHLFVQAQVDPTTPSIQKIDKEDIKKMETRESNEFQYYIDSKNDSLPIKLQRDENNPAVLHVKGRGSLNHIEIYENADDAYPILSQTFRGVHYEAVDLKKLNDGVYFLRIISNHKDTETELTLQTIGKKADK